jgi:phosphoribosyl 1,2-cyclic phosphodiesterase
MGLKVKLWGIRGSLPAPHTPTQIEEKMAVVLKRYLATGGSVSPADFLNSLKPYEAGGFGGHTSCMQYFSPQATVIIDGGSGIRGLGEELMAGPCGRGQGQVHLFMTHFHWDHLMGLPFFTPLFVPGNRISFYAVQDDLEQNIRNLFRKPNFPVPYESLAAKISFKKLTPRQGLQIEDMRLTPYKLDHPDPCWGYRIESGGKSVAHCVDTEARRFSREELGEDLPLYQKADLMVFDAQYSFLEATEKVDWGHASGPLGIDLALRESISKVLFIHHDPAASDDKIAAVERQTREYYEARIKAVQATGQPIPHVDWCFAREGMVIEA